MASKIASVYHSDKKNQVKKFFFDSPHIRFASEFYKVIHSKSSAFFAVFFAA